MSVVVTVVYNRMPVMAANLRAKASAGVRKTAFTYEGNLKQRMTSGPKTGRMYITSVQVRERATSLVVTRSYHQASAPGQAPAVDTGVLLNSIATEAIRGSLEATVSTSVEYAPHLEYGTMHMGARPAWTPEAELAATTYFPANMQQALGEAYR